MRYTIDPTMTYSEAVLFYEESHCCQGCREKAGIFPALYHRSLLEGFSLLFYLTSDENFCVLNLS